MHKVLAFVILGLSLAACAGAPAAPAAPELPACDNPGVQNIIARIRQAPLGAIKLVRDTNSAQRDKRWCSAVEVISVMPPGNDRVSTPPVKGRQFVYSVEFTDADAGRYWVEVKPGYVNCYFPHGTAYEAMGYPACK
jgi:hypothetical protein